MSNNSTVYIHVTLVPYTVDPLNQRGPHLWIQPTPDGVELYYLLLKKCGYKWTHAIQTPVVQESAVSKYLASGKEYVHLHRWEGCWMAFGNRFADSVRSNLSFVFMGGRGEGNKCFILLLLYLM